VQIYRTKDAEVTEEAEAARKLIDSIIEDPSTPSDNVALAHIDGRIEAAVTDVRRLLNEEHSQLISQLEGARLSGGFNARSSGLTPSETSSTKGLMKSARVCWPRSTPALQRFMVNQQRAIWVTVIVTAIAAILGLLFAGLVGGGITRPVRLLLQGGPRRRGRASSIDPSTSSPAMRSAS